MHILESAINGWFKSVCNCNISKLQQQNDITCLDSTTISITTVFQSNENNTAQAMIDKIVNYIQEQNHSVVYLESDWAICLNASCEWKLDIDNSTISRDKSDDKNFIPLIVGIVVGIILCAIGLYLLFFCILRRVHIKSRLVHEHYYVAMHAIL